MIRISIREFKFSPCVRAPRDFCRLNFLHSAAVRFAYTQMSVEYGGYSGD